METSNKKLLQDLVIMKSSRLAHHRIIPISKQEIPPIIKQYCDYLSVDASLQRKFLMCQWCEQVFTNSRANRRNIEKHLIEKHNLGAIQSCPSPVPEMKPEIKSVEEAPIKKPSKRGRPTKPNKPIQYSAKFPTLKFKTIPCSREGPMTLETLVGELKSFLDTPANLTPPPNSPTQPFLEITTETLPETKIVEADLVAKVAIEKEVGSGPEEPQSIKLKKDKVRSPKKPKLNKLTPAKLSISEPSILI